MFGFFRSIPHPKTQAARIGLLTICILLIVLILPKGVRFKYEFEKGQIWLHDDLVAPAVFPILKTEHEIDKNKSDILISILPVYQLNPTIGALQIESFKKEFERKWLSKGKYSLAKTNNYQAGTQLLEQVYERGIIAFRKSGNSFKDYNLTLVRKNVAEDVNTATLFTINKALKYCQNKLRKYYAIDTTFMFQLLEDHLTTNVEYNEAFTGKIQEEALAQISLTHGIVQKGEIIIFKGNIIDERTYQKLVSLRAYFEQKSGNNSSRYFIYLGQFLLVSIIVSLLMVFLYLFRKDIYYDNRQISLILLIVTTMLVVLSWAIKSHISSLYLIPYCITPIIIRILFDTRLALNIHLLVVIIASFFVPNGFEFVFLQITTGMVAIYSLRNLNRRSQFLISAVVIFLTYLVGYIGIVIINNGYITDINYQNIIWFAASSLLSLLAYPLIYLFERLFGITSDFTLLELSSGNSRLLRELSFKAPGTFQHSLQVANLAEEVIYQIGGNALLIRTGALYHDIGKMRNPQYFIENQNAGQNPHDALKYDESARIIIEHVDKGVELARKYQLPEMVVDFIRTHHGNTRVDYFYQSFLKSISGKTVDETVFRYPGPIPFTKEQAVLMLADSVEAASRSLKEPNESSINALVDRIVDYKLTQNQLKDSDITLKEIETIRKTFKNMLISIYHVRIEYPMGEIK